LLRGGKPLALLIRLAIAGGRPLARVELADLLWGDESPDRARASLRQGLHTLRRSIGAGALVADRDSVALAPACMAIDRDEMLRAVRSGAADEALHHYDGPFCGSLEVAGASAFERWATAERGYLQRLLLDAAQAGITRALAEGRGDEAVTMARRLVAVVPEDTIGPTLLFDALVATGALAEARERIEAARAALATNGEPIPPEIAERAGRLHGLEAARYAPSAGSLEMLGHALVGREGVLHDLVREAERARAGRPRRVALVAPAGMGKTRLLDELEARMRLRGARVVRVRFLPGMQDVPGSAVADLVRLLTDLPGALGVSEETARTLVEMAPSLATRYPAAPRASGGGPSPSAIARREALADLIGAVAEDRLVILLVDDLQYADEVSRQLMASTPRPTSARLLEVFGVRPGLALAPFGSDSECTLAPLEAPEVRLMLESVAPLPTLPSVEPMLIQLARRSRGVPLALHALIRGLTEMGVLVLAGGGWVVPNAEGLLAAIDQMAGVGEVLASLRGEDRRVLRLLAAWGRPMEEHDLTGMLGGGFDAASALARLAALGLVQSRDATWRVTHDTISDGAGALPLASGEEPPIHTFVSHWARQPRLTVPVIEHLGFLCGLRDDLAAAERFVARVANLRRLRDIGLRGRSLADLVARAAGRPDWATPLAKQMGFLAKRSDAGLAMLGAVATFSAGVLVWFAAMWQPRLVIEAEPMAEIRSSGVYDLVVQPRVSVRNGFGRPLRLAIPVRAVASGASLFGDSVARLTEGRYQFERLVVQPHDSLPPETNLGRLTITGPWYVRSASVMIRGLGPTWARDDFRLLRLRVEGGVLVGPTQVRARLGDSLRFDMTFAFTTTGATANYVVGASPTWEDRRMGLIRLAGLPSPVQDGWRTVTFSVSPPPVVGVHYVVVAFGAEDGVDYLFSSTNWTLGRPRWFDGNDLLDLPVDSLEHARLTGRLGVLHFWGRHFPGIQAELRVGGQIMRDDWKRRNSFVEQRSVRGNAIRVDVIPP
jgi:DNA-binding SARP family transcriptional activator